MQPLGTAGVGRCVGGAAAAAAMLMLVAAMPAYAGFGAVAYDQNTGKHGASWNAPTQAEAFERALKQCGSPGCRVHPVQPQGCGALATSDKDQAWGGADRATLADAEHDAVIHCQSHTKAGTCTVRLFGCNR